jgi:hypothetical protein
MFLFAPVAQWIERQPPELKAAGSNPAGRTIKNKGFTSILEPFIFSILFKVPTLFPTRNANFISFYSRSINAGKVIKIHFLSMTFWMW